MNIEKLADDIRTLAEENSMDIVGFADLRNLPPEMQTGFPYGISIAAALNPEIIVGIRNGPTKRYHEEYTRVNQLLDSAGKAISRFLREMGYKASYTAATDTAIDTGKHSDITDMTTLSAQLSHKMVATRAGLGWIGKNDLLVTPVYGSAVRLTSVLTDAVLPFGEPVNEPKCGDCRACVDACPAGVLTGKNWYPGIQRESLVDAAKCRETALELTRRNFDKEVSICGVCIAACPRTQRYLKKVI
jgi:epoxyqueuosine reductase